MEPIYTEQDADRSALKGGRVAIIGFAIAASSYPAARSMARAGARAGPPSISRDGRSLVDMMCFPAMGYIAEACRPVESHTYSSKISRQDHLCLR